MTAVLWFWLVGLSALTVLLAIVGRIEANAGRAHRSSRVTAMVRTDRDDFPTFRKDKK